MVKVTLIKILITLFNGAYKLYFNGIKFKSCQWLFITLFSYYLLPLMPDNLLRTWVSFHVHIYEYQNSSQCAWPVEHRHLQDRIILFYNGNFILNCIILLPNASVSSTTHWVVKNFTSPPKYFGMSSRNCTLFYKFIYQITF